MSFHRTYDRIIRQGDFVKAYYDGVPISDQVKSLKVPQGRRAQLDFTEEDRSILFQTLEFVHRTEARHYQLGHADPERTTFYGVVHSINEKRSKVSVTAWKMLGEVLTTAKRFEIVFPMSDLTKISRSDFFAICQRPYMARLDHRTRLRAAGFDESAPLSLIAYNNRIVSSLMERVDTSVSSMHTKFQGQRSRHRLHARTIPTAPGKLKALPTPQFNFTIDDPLAEVRAELNSLNTGVKKRKNKGGNVLQSHHEEMISTGQTQRSDTVLMPSFGSPQNAMSETDESLSMSYDVSRTNITRSVGIGSSCLYVQLNARPILRVGNMYKFRLQGFEENTGTLYVVREDAVEADLPVTASLCGIALFFSALDPSLPLRTSQILTEILTPTKGCFHAEVVGWSGNTVVLDAQVGGAWLQKLLIQRGVAWAYGSLALEGVASSTDFEQTESITPRRIGELTSAQNIVAQEQVGMWQSESALKGFLRPEDEGILNMDKDASVEGDILPALFTAVESTQGLRARIRQMFQGV